MKLNLLYLIFILMSESSPILKKMIIMMVLLTLGSMQSPSYAAAPAITAENLVEIP